MCINPAVNSLKSITLINDRCKELQKNSASDSRSSASATGADNKRRRSSTASCSCPYYNQNRIRHLTDRALVSLTPLIISIWLPLNKAQYINLWVCHVSLFMAFCRRLTQLQVPKLDQLSEKGRRVLSHFHKLHYWDLNCPINKFGTVQQGEI